MSNVTVHFHGPVTIHVREGGAGAPSPQSAAEAAVAASAEPFGREKKQLFDEDYSNRTGYDPGFLGVNLPLPDVHSERRGEILKGTDRKILVLKYHHYSLVMNKSRLLQHWSAANVDYSPSQRDIDENRQAFGGETWRLDPRVPQRFQLEDRDFYQPAHTIDRGHIVRRDDGAWGATFEERARANADTYHWTNCTPQHERFNQSRQSPGRWGALEDQIKDEAIRAGSRLSIFAGPVLADDDPEVLGFQIPMKFWKVLCARVDGSLQVYGFVLDQRPVVDRFGFGIEAEALDFSAFKEEQTSLQTIEGLTGVAFDRVLHDADVMAGDSPREIRRREDVRRPEALPVR